MKSIAESLKCIQMHRDRTISSTGFGGILLTICSSADEKSIGVVAHQETKCTTWLYYRILFSEYIPKFNRLDLVGLDWLYINHLCFIAYFPPFHFFMLIGDVRKEHITSMYRTRRWRKFQR